MSGINFSSIENICNNSNQVMVYGWKHAGYVGIIYFLKEIDESTNTTIKKYFDCWLGDKHKRDERVTTLEGRKIERIEYDSIEGASHTAKMCKSALVNIVLENCKREKENLHSIPLLFCYDIENNPFPKSIETIATRDKPHNDYITNKELRRIYKLCFFEDSFISNVALKTVKFVKVLKNSNDEYELEELKPFWENSKWKSLWQERQKTKTIKEKNNRWQDQLTESLKAFNVSI